MYVIHVYAQMYIYIHMYMYMYIYVYAHMYMYIYVSHACNSQRSMLPLPAHRRNCKYLSVYQYLCSAL